jgi:hypothetical protein
MHNEKSTKVGVLTLKLNCICHLKWHIYTSFTVHHIVKSCTFVTIALGQRSTQTFLTKKKLMYSKRTTTCGLIFRRFNCFESSLLNDFKRSSHQFYCGNGRTSRYQLGDI